MIVSLLALTTAAIAMLTATTTFILYSGTQQALADSAKMYDYLFLPCFWE
jgi:hypothetical protein